jgi:hypothetical protein
MLVNALHCSKQIGDLQSLQEAIRDGESQKAQQINIERKRGKKIILKPRSQSNQEAKENKKRTSHDSRPRLSRITETYSRAAKLVC